MTRVPFSVRTMEEADVQAILAWRYAAPYDFYNLGDGDQEALFDPANHYHAVIDADGRLAGFCAFGPDARVMGEDLTSDPAALDVGWGMRPDLTGQGHSTAFLAAILEFGRVRFVPSSYRMVVATFNRRAIRLYEKVGFQPVGTFVNPAPGRQQEFLQMTLTLDAGIMAQAPGGERVTVTQDFDLKRYIRDVPDFPQTGVLFRDITPLLSDPRAFSYAVDALTSPFLNGGLDAIVGIESRGFLFGAPLAYRLHIPFVPVRKSGKLPARVMSIEYALEYGTSQLDIHADALQPGQRVAIVDDVLATGGTARAAAELVERLQGRVEALLFLIELGFLNGRERLEGYEIHSLVRY
jgi:adenine phosphoribosyltransferase